MQPRWKARLKHTCFSGSVIPMKKTKGIRFSLQGKLLFPVVIALTLFMGSSALFLSHFLTEKTEERFVTMLSAGNEILVKNIRNATESYKSVMRTISIIPQLKLLADVASDRGERSPFERFPDQYKDGVWGKAEDLLLTLSDNFPDIVQFTFALRNGNVIASSRRVTIGKALAIIREESGTHFDLSVVDAFFAARKDVVTVERHFERKVSFSA